MHDGAVGDKQGCMQAPGPVVFFKYARGTLLAMYIYVHSCISY